MALKEESLVALRVAHLSMIQGVIARMSGFSASAKTFTITILAGLAAISLQADAAQLGVIAMISAIALFLVDTYYMTLEVRFRNFYDEVAARDLDQASNLKIAPSVNPGDTKRAINSKSNWLFYGPVLFASTLFICYGLIHERKSERLSRSDTPRVERPADTGSAVAGKRVESSVQPTAATKGDIGRLPGQSIGAAGAERIVRGEPAAERSGRPVRAEAAGSTPR
ncbi:MAG: hypothetical protein BGP16_11740 [Sphingobium sp. 66-54]|nr:MAG: hypothetical protein BGP16_11740 [Sphingobium sp. 66-54]